MSCKSKYKMRALCINLAILPVKGPEIDKSLPIMQVAQKLDKFQDFVGDYMSILNKENL